MNKNGLFPGMATAIGSLPHTDMETGLDLVFENAPCCPHWPQLMTLRYTEKMEVQPVEGLPGVRHQPEKGSVYVDTVAGEAELAGFYEKALAAEQGGDLEPFALSRDYAEGIYAFVERLKTMDKKPPVTKAQLIGPFSFGFSITDQDGRAILYHPTWADVCMKLLYLKGLWQVRMLEPFTEQVLYFLDEPMLSAYGSTAMLTVSRDEVIDRLNQVIEPLKAAGALVGTHCCGNTDWGLVMEAHLDVINFDAYEYGDTVGIYPEQANEFMQRGGWFAVGIAPTSAEIDHEDEGSMLEKLNQWIDNMARAGIDKDMLSKKIVITPSCGCKTLTVPQAEKIYHIIKCLQDNYAA